MQPLINILTGQPVLSGALAPAGLAPPEGSILGATDAGSIADSHFQREGPGNFLEKLAARAARLLQPRNIFIPKTRRAILVNGKDLDGFSLLGRKFAGSGYDRLSLPINRGNRAMYGTEAALSGRVLLPLDNRLRNPKHLFAYRESFQNEFETVAAQALQSGRDCLYPEVHKVFPDEPDMVARFGESVISIANIAAEDDLTLVWIYSHGRGDGFRMGIERKMNYSELISLLDQIRGKKIVILCSCYSGNFVRFIEGLSQRESYAVMASTSFMEMGTNWVDDHFHEIVERGLSSGMRFSQIRMGRLRYERDEQTPTRFLGFDVFV